MTWDEYFILLTDAVAVKSKDTSTKVGAIIVDKDNGIVATGFNGPPRRVDESPEERRIRPAKYLWTEHAERNSIYDAARQGKRTQGCTMYNTNDNPTRTDFSCADCARAIVQAGITRVVFRNRQGTTSLEWDESQKVAQEIFLEAGVIVKKVNIPLRKG